MLERTDAITKEVIEPIKFVLAYPTVFSSENTALIFIGIKEIINKPDQ